VTVVTSPTVERPTAAPPVVAVMVVHDPGDWFAETLASLAAQDYPDVRLVALLTAATGSATSELIRQTFPSAVVRTVEGNPGFGPVVNQALSLVQGTDGFFLVLHDDVALREDAVSHLVDEAFRSNAAVVGPKLVEWDAPDVLQHVGLDCDRAGQLVAVVDPGERDQEQHDSVRDVFAIPSACLLVRNDVFREVGGFAPNIPFLGEELELSWRVHLLGARVVVNPAAVVRHRGAFATRATMRHLVTRRERHRVRTVTTCSALPQLPLVALRLLIGSVLELVVGSFAGRGQDALAGLRAVAGLAVDAPLIVERRRALRSLRRVPGREVTALQLRSSARIASFVRHRRALREQHTSEIPVVGAVSTPVARSTTFVALAIIALLIIGNRGFIWGQLSGIGQTSALLASGVSPLDAAREYLLGWSPNWFGTTGPAPTYLGAMAVLGVVFLGNYAALLTAIMVGAFFVAAIGAWRLCGVLGDSRVRLFGAAVYLALPVGVMAARDGRRDAIILWALLPWLLDFARRVAGLLPDQREVARETSVRSAGDRRAQLLASSVLLMAAAATFAPATTVVVALLALLLLAAAPLTATPWRASAWLVASLLIAIGGAAVLHVPWSVDFVGADWWQHLLGAGHPATQAPLLHVASFGVGNAVWRWLVIAAYLPVVVAALALRGARAAWPTRALFMVAVPVVLQFAAERGVLAVRLPEPLMLSAISSLGMSLAAAVMFAEFIGGRHKALTWRQLFAVASLAGVVVASLPTLVASLDGRWSQPDDTLGRLAGQLPAQDTGDDTGDYAVLYIGDARLMPATSASIVTRDAASGDEQFAGLAYSILHDGGATGIDTLPAAPSTMTAALARAVEVLATGESLRAGRLLAPLAVRYVVVPLRDSTLYASRPLRDDTKNELVARISDQLDFRRVFTATDLVIFENAAALPMATILEERAAVASQQAGESNLLAEPLVNRGSLIAGLVAGQTNTALLTSGTVHLAVPFSDRWTLRVDGARIAPRVAFGGTTAFDAPIAGTATLQLRASLAQRLFVAVQVALWMIVLAVTFNPSRFRGKVRAAREVVEVSLRNDDQRVGVS